MNEHKHNLNCPYCPGGMLLAWGFSPEGWARAKARHERGECDPQITPTAITGNNEPVRGGWRDDIRCGAPWTQDGKKMLEHVAKLLDQAKREELEWVLEIAKDFEVGEFAQEIKDRLKALTQPHEE